MALNLTRPLVFFDLETTGIDLLKDRIVEICIIKLNPDGTTIEKTRRINPGRPIPAEATAIHHITDADVASEPRFEQIAVSLAEFLTGCDFAGFNSNRFDLPMLDEAFHRAGIDFDFSGCRFIDVQTIYHKREPRTLEAAYRFYCDKNLTDAHSAAGDTRATLEVLQAQLEKYTDLPGDIDKLAEVASQKRNVDFMGRLVYDDKDRITVNFGKYKGRTIDEVLDRDPGYYSWIMEGDFASNTKRAFTRAKMLHDQKKQKK